MYIITKEFTFEAAHRLLGHPKCGRLHGHSYRVEVELQAQRVPLSGPDAGMVRDYADLGRIKEILDNEFDHRYLVGQELIFADDPYYLANPAEVCEIADIYRTTAESLAYYFYARFKVWYRELTAVRVSETAKTWAEYRPERG